MGSAIARRLLSQEQQVYGWNRTPEKGEPLVALGLGWAETPAQLVAAVDYCLILLSDAQAIGDTLSSEAVLNQLPGRTCLQMGTIAPDQSRALAHQIEGVGGRYLEAPVLGSRPEAEAGKLIIMAGGSGETFEHCLPLLRLLGEAPRLVGSVGQGAVVKLAMNQLIAGLTASFSLSLGLVRAEGVSVELFMDLLRNSALYAPTFDKKLLKYLNSTYGEANFSLKHLRKDVHLFRQVAESLGLDGTLLTAMEQACDRGMDQGLADRDYSVLYEILQHKA